MAHAADCAFALAFTLTLAACPLAAQQRALTVLYNFGDTQNGSLPDAALAIDAAGNLYGTTLEDATPTSPYGGNGTIFKVDPAGNETVLWNFPGNAGTWPNGVVRDSAGNLYGTTRAGNLNKECKSRPGCGGIFRLDAAGNFTVLHRFHGRDGAAPVAGVTLDSSGNLYGATQDGGSANYGVVFKLDAAGSYSVLHHFTQGADGAQPLSVLLVDSAGNLYGTASTGGAHGSGVIYKIDATGTFTVLYAFRGASNGDGAMPVSGLTAGLAGNLYGTTENGGKNNMGTVYRLDPAGHETVLFNFADGGNGLKYPRTGVVLDPVGNLIGTCSLGGKNGTGVIYRIETSGQFRILHNFRAGEGRFPNDLIRDSTGNFYGTTRQGGSAKNGVVFEFVP